MDKIVNKLIKSYFNLTPLHNNKKSSRVSIRFRRLSLNRIMVSRAEIKHTNNKVIITVYLYNKNQKFFLYKLKNLYKKLLFRARKNIPSLNVIKKNTNTSNGYFLPRKNGSKFAIFVYEKKSFSKFSSKRLKKNHRKLTRNIKRNYFINFTNLTKKNLMNFIFKFSAKNPDLALKNQYKALVSKYYFLLSNNPVNVISNNNYFVNYVKLANYNASVKDNTDIYPSNLYNSALKKNQFFTTRLSSGLTPVPVQSEITLNNNEKNLLDENKVKNALAFENIFNLNKTRKPRNINNFIHKLRNLHKLFFISKMYNINPTNQVVLDKPSYFIKNLHNILKNKSTFLKKINRISLKGLRILYRARKNQTIILKTLK